MKINEVIQVKRKALNMTQLQLAEKLDVSDKTVSRWESGIVYPNVDMIPKIAFVLKITINELFGDNALTEKKINIAEKRDYRKMTIFKIFLYILIACSIISLILFFCGIWMSHNEKKNYSIILILSAVIIFLISSGLFFINRLLYQAFYKEKFYCNEYKLLDARATSLAISINSFLFGSFLFSPSNFYITVSIFTFFIIVNLTFLKKLGFTYQKRALFPIILTIIIYVVLLFFAILSIISHFVVAIQIIFLILIMHLLACLSLELFIKSEPSSISY